MTEEEKKLIDGFFNKGWCCDLDEIYNVVMKMSALIEKLQKENEELRAITNGYNSLKKDSETFGGIPLIIADEKYFNDGIFTVNFIPKDKIREKIRYLGDEGYYEFNTERDLEKAIEMFKELLEEE